MHIRDLCSGITSCKEETLSRIIQEGRVLRSKYLYLRILGKPVNHIGSINRAGVNHCKFLLQWELRCFEKNCVLDFRPLLQVKLEQTLVRDPLPQLFIGGLALYCVLTDVLLMLALCSSDVEY